MANGGVDYAAVFSNHKEHPEPFKARIKGKIPSWVKGTLLRNGPGMFDIGPDEYNHWFDGMALIQRFHVENGEVVFSTKYLQSETYRRNMAAQRIVVSEFGTVAVPDPCKSIFSRYFSYFFPSHFTDNDLVNFVQCGDQVYASSETSILNRIDPETLETLEQVKMAKYIAINIATAHPHYDAEGHTLNMASSLTAYHIVKIPLGTEDGPTAFEGAKILASIPAKSTYLSYYHSFGLSTNFIVFPEMPLLMNPWRLASSIVTRHPFVDALQWYSDQDVEFHLVDLRNGQRLGLKFTADPFFTFHHANAYEEGDCLVCDVCAYKDANLIKQVSLKRMREGLFTDGNPASVPRLWRFVFPLQIPADAKEGENVLPRLKFNTKATAVLKGKNWLHCTPEVICDSPFEFPRINYALNGKRYRFLYGTELPDEKHQGTDLFGERVLKIDVESGEVKGWQRDNQFQLPGEPVFVPRPGSTKEDDGVILCPVVSAKQGEWNFLLVLDAETFEELARAEVEPSVPVGFHGHYLPRK